MQTPIQTQTLTPVPIPVSVPVPVPVPISVPVPIIKMYSKKLYINISIKNYNNFDNNIELIKLIDNHLINKKEKIYGFDYEIKWTKSIIPITEYDYKCIIIFSGPFDLNIINKYVQNKFISIQNYIKFNFDKFGTNWSIDYEIY